MDRRTFVTNGVIAATALLLGACKGYRKVDDPDPNNWIDRNRDQDWLEDDDNFQKPEARHRDRDGDTERKHG